MTVTRPRRAQGFAALGAGRLDEARAAFERARSIGPRVGRHWTDRGESPRSLPRRRFAALRAQAIDFEA